MDIVLKAEERQLTGKQTKKIRKSGSIPAVLYSAGNESQNIQILEKDFLKTYEKAGHSTLVEILLNEKPLKVLIEEVQINPKTGRSVHVMFNKVNLKEEVNVEVPIEVTGESDAIKIEKGVLVTPEATIEIRCLPTNIPASFSVDISTLKNIGDSITVADITLSPGVQLVHEEDIEKVIVLIAAPQKEEVEEVTPSVEDVGIVGEGTKEQEKTQEGAS